MNMLKNIIKNCIPFTNRNFTFLLKALTKIYRYVFKIDRTTGYKCPVRHLRGW